MPGKANCPGKALEELKARWQDCQDCPLAAGRTRWFLVKETPGQGDAGGGRAGREEDRQGRPFVGAAGSSWTKSWLRWV
jgi:uracil-DNA glycosylase